MNQILCTRAHALVERLESINFVDLTESKKKKLLKRIEAILFVLTDSSDEEHDEEHYIETFSVEDCLESPFGKLFQLGVFSDFLTESNDVCPICLDHFTKNSIVRKAKKCGHMYCEDCIIGWVEKHNSCPNCRSIF